MEGYTVEHTRHGVVLRGQVPISDFSALANGWKAEGLTLLATGIAMALKATFAVARPESLEEWQREIDEQAQRRSGGDPELTWLSGRDTGVSSLTIFSVLASTEGRRETVRAQMEESWGPDIPHDPDDFGRCYRMLKLFPEWRARMGEVADAYPAWGPLVEQWDRLTELFEEETAKGNRAPKLYALMRQIIERRRGGNAR